MDTCVYNENRQMCRNEVLEWEIKKNEQER